MYFLADSNSFFTSVEKVFDFKIRGLPIISLSSNDGTIIALSESAKKLGLKKGTAFFKIKSFCEQNGVVVRSANFPLISDISARVMATVGRFAPEQYCYSIDEMLLRYQNINKVIPNLTDHARLIRKTVYKECKIPISVGGGSSITISKVANKLAKQHKSLNGALVIESENTRIRALKATMIEDIWGIGRRLAPKLSLMGFKTAYDLSQMNLNVARSQFSINLERTVRELNGVPCYHWDEVEPDQQQIFSTSTLGLKIFSKEPLLQALSKHAAVAAHKARRKNLKSKAVTCFIANSAFDQAPVHLRAMHEFEFATNDTCSITKAVTAMGSQLFKENIAFNKVGVGLLELSNVKNTQYDLFNSNPENPALMLALDGINARYGRDTIYLGSQGTDSTPKWGAKKEYLSKEYTTNWEHIPVVNAV